MSLFACVALAALAAASCREDNFAGVNPGLGSVCHACHSDSDCVSPLTCGSFGEPFSQCGYGSITCAVSLDGGGRDGSQVAGGGGGGGGGVGGGGGGGTGGGSGDGGPSDGAPNDAFWSPDAAGVMAPLATPNGYTVTALAVNNRTGTLYAPMTDVNGNNTGIAVFSTATNALVTTIPPVQSDGGSAAPYVGSRLLAVDPAANLLYAVRQSSSIVDIFDGATNQYLQSFDATSSTFDDICPAGAILQWLAIDPSRSLVYVSCPIGTTALEVDVVVFQNAASVITYQREIVMNDLQSSTGALALDPVNQLLYVANIVPGAVPSPAPPLLVDVASTVNGAEISQQNLGPAIPVGMLGGSGFATLLAMTTSDAGLATGPATFYSLEQSDGGGLGATLPATFTAANYELGSGQDAPDVYWVIGTDSNVAQGPIVAEVSIFPDAGAPRVLGETPFSTPVSTAATLQVYGFVAGSVYSYLNGFETAEGPTGPFAWSACLP